ncbi:MAG: helicase HerA domain-containing protein [Candidatus Nanohaloarchaea archaeon]
MQLGTIQGEVDTSSFTFRATEEVRKFDFVSVKSNDKWILAQVDEVTKHPDGETVAEANIIGYRDKGLTKAPRRVIEPDSIVYSADQELISDTLGLEDAGLGIGNLETNPDIDIHVDGEEFYKHFAVLAQTGAGKSYLTGVLIEELLEADFPLVIIDPHGEYSSLGTPNPEREEGSRAYDIKEFSPNTDINSSALPLSFSSVNLEKNELLEIIPDSLTNSQMGVLYNALKRLREKEEDYNLTDIMDAVSQEESTAKWNLLNSLEQVEQSGLFSESPVDLENLVEPGRATVVNMKAVEPEEAEITMYMLAQKLFDLRKRDRVPPFLMVIEEAHNFAPEKGFSQAQSNDILRKIASEGRKFGLGIGVISQRPARIDKNVLSQCNTQFILRVTNPNDLKAISKSFEGVTSEVEDMIKSLPPGVAFVLGKDYPVMTDVRTRRSKHGGETETGSSYEKRESIEVLPPKKSQQELEAEKGEKYSAAYYPLYLLENDEKQLLVDGTSGEVKSERARLSGKEREVFELASQGMSKGEIVEELDEGVAKVSSLMERLREKGRLGEEGTEESVLDIEPEEERVPEDALIEYEVPEGEARGMLEDSSLRRIYYPYYSREEEVYDPILLSALD